MKNILKLSVALLVSGMLLNGSLKAQSPEERLAHLKTQLALSDQQAEQVAAILQQNREQLAAARTENRGDFEALRAAEKDIRERERQQIMGVLSEEQQKKFAEIQEKQLFARGTLLGERSADFLERLQQELSLTDEQVAAITPGLQAFDQKMAAAREEMGRPSRGNRDKMRKMMDERNKAIEKHLNDEQKKRFKELLEAQRKAFQEQRGGPPRDGQRPPRRW